ncbi:MAG: hypothetical protein COW67_02980 [Flavobacteriales bacterium CG18_big_fil_WC_8_21_14_2_50_32_9]|nr:MAG: hypothetical protein COW67_02980 [Flavobacteriales bacterium CG18_big_fil_WC_8_21_14_2_50_32_9]
MTDSSEIFKIFSKIIDGKTPNLFSSKNFKKAYNHPNKSTLIKLANRMLEIQDEWDMNVETKLNEVKNINKKLKALWN